MDPLNAGMDALASIVWWGFIALLAPAWVPVWLLGAARIKLFGPVPTREATYLRGGLYGND